MRDPKDEHDGYAVAFDIETYPDGDTEDDVHDRAVLCATYLRDVDVMLRAGGFLEFGQA